MRTDPAILELRKYIGAFRSWIKTSASPALSDNERTVADEWMRDLDSAEALLENKPELPIALLGPSQQGKSSLINALLGENILAVGGAIGACTCVITSVHYSETDGFDAEIEFISLEAWRKELQSLQRALSQSPGSEDTGDDAKQLDEERRAAVEKLCAVYRIEDASQFNFDAISHPTCNLPLEITECMRSGECIRVHESTAVSLKNKVRRYLVGREQYQDGQYWPLISRVKIRGRFEILSNGVVLVDLPGLNDPNPAREKVTREYLNTARFLWLVCNSQTGIDRVMDNLLRDGGMLFRLFLEGRLDAFAVVATKVDQTNFDAVFEQMGTPADDFDGDYAKPLTFRRKQIEETVREHLLRIGKGILERAANAGEGNAFLERLNNVRVFSVATATYLHLIKKQTTYHGPQLPPAETQLPALLEHLHDITLEHSYRRQLESANRRLRVLYERARGFFLNRLQILEQADQTARAEWDKFCTSAVANIESSKGRIFKALMRAEENLQIQSKAFAEKLGDLDSRAKQNLGSVFEQWNSMNWRSLQAAIKRNGEWYSSSTARDFNLNRDVAHAFLDLVPLVWDDFFGKRLSTIIEELSREAQHAIESAADQVRGSVGMLSRQPAGLVDSMTQTLSNSSESYSLRSAKIQTDLAAQIQRTRQSLSNGLIGTSAAFMQPAYARAQNVDGGTGVKRRMLEPLMQHARANVGSLFVNMRKELAEGVAEMSAGLRPRLKELSTYGESILVQLQQNVRVRTISDQQHREQFKQALNTIPPIVKGEAS